jgi:hypothetical protein
MIIRLLLLILFLSSKVYSQNIYSVNFKYQSDVKVFVTDNKINADLLIYKVDHKYEAKENKGSWYFCEYKYQAEKNIFFTEYSYQSDLRVFVVDYKYLAGWINKEKIDLFY